MNSPRNEGKYSHNSQWSVEPLCCHPFFPFLKCKSAAAVPLPQRSPAGNLALSQRLPRIRPSCPTCPATAQPLVFISLFPDLEQIPEILLLPDKAFPA